MSLPSAAARNWLDISSCPKTIRVSSVLEACNGRKGPEGTNYHPADGGPQLSVHSTERFGRHRRNERHRQCWKSRERVDREG